ncbi:MAG: tetratricopeptide repeat protein [Acidobacteria bacterium]|nr:tetratricopeptide repeat protein [Acidobacteriota bacterium]
MFGLRRWVAAAALLLCAGGVAAAQTGDAYFQYLMARRLEAQGDHDRALAALERAATVDPASAEVRAEIASFQLRRNQRGDAEREALRALRLDDTNREAHRVLGVIYAADVEAMGTRGARAQVEERTEQAISHLERVTSGAAYGVGIQIYYSLGQLYMRAGDSEKAIDAFREVVDQNPGAVQGRLSLARAYAAADDVAGAIASLEVIVDVEPRVASTLAQYQEQAGLLAEAAASYTRALAVEPTSRALKFRRVAAVFNNRDFAQAAEYAAEAQAQHPGDLRFARLRARAVFENGDSAEALTILEPTARAYPTDAATQLALADLYSDTGRDEEAEQTLRRYLATTPADAMAMNHLGYLLADRGKALDEAIRLVERALDADPGNPSYLDSLGWAHFRRGDFEEAEKYLLPAAEQLPGNAVVQDHLGDVLAGQGRWLDAIAAWTRALEGNGGIDTAAIEQKVRDARSRVPR